MNTAMEDVINGMDATMWVAHNRYLALQIHVKDRCGDYISKMACEMGIVTLDASSARHVSIQEWAKLVNLGDEKATKAWCFAVEYVPNASFQKTGKRLQMIYGQADVGVLLTASEHWISSED